MKIESLHLREVRMPLVETFSSAAVTLRERRLLLVEARSADGRVGWGECVALAEPSYLPETVDTAWLVVRRWLGPAALDFEWQHPGRLADHLAGKVRGHAMARAALEMAAWDLAAQAAGLPLAAFLGGERRRVETGIALSFDSDEELAGKAARAAAEGYRRLRLKIRPGQDLEAAATVLGAVQGKLPITADANGTYRLEDAAHLARLAEVGVDILEQPLHWQDLVDHGALQRQLPLAVALDESVRSVAAARQMLALGSGRVLNIKPGRVGGLAAALAIHDLCRPAGVDLFVGGMLETGIGRAFNVALASLPGFTLPGDLGPSARYWRRDLVEPEWTMEQGWVTVPWERPGLGVEVDRQRIETLTVRKESLGAAVTPRPSPPGEEREPESVLQKAHLPGGEGLG